jgi:tetraacyldisaccharide 4'-kinase
MLEPEVVLHPKRFFLRENLNSLQRANIVVVLDVKENERDLISGKISKFTNAKLFFGFRQIDNLYSLAEKKALDLSYLKNRRISAFCGIAHPERFMKTLLNLNFNIVGFLTFPDHCEYKNRELEKLAKFFNDTSAEILITTEKDAVKLPHLLFNLPLYYLSLKLQLENESEFLSLVFGSL